MNRARSIIISAKNEGRSTLDLAEAREVAEDIGIKMNKAIIAKNREEAIKNAEKIGYPVAMKIVSPQIIHKTEAGGILINLNNKKEVAEGYEKILKSVMNYDPKAKIKGIIVEEMIKGTELIVGTAIDQQFGKMIMFGIGGIFVEVYKDVSFRIIPINEEDAKEMIEEIKGKAIFEGARGLPKADKKEIVDILLKVSNAVEKIEEIKEMDINPLIVTKDGLRAVDARFVI
ncbi:MAG: acetate--CoA ligase family protein [Candidatus Thermoplasmatota archaeon]